MYDDEIPVITAIRSGARAFVLKRAFSSELLGALRMLARDGSYLSSKVSDRLLTHIQSGHVCTHERGPLEGLLARELQVWQLVARGQIRITVLLDLGLETVAAKGRP